MKNALNMQRQDRRSVILYGVVAVLAIGYSLALFFQPTTAASAAVFNISNAALAILKITIAMPIILVWFLGAASIAGSLRHADGSPHQELKRRYRSLAYALGFLVSGLIVGAMFGEIRSYYPNSASVQRIGTILANYMYVFPPLVGFWLLYHGMRSDTERKEFTNQNRIVAAILVGIIGILWMTLIFTNEGRQTSSLAGLSPSFYLSDGAIIASIIMPTLLSWFFGIRAALALSDLYMQDSDRWHVFSRLIAGIWLLIFSYIIILGLLSAGGARLLALGLTGILVAIYLFLFVLLAAHWMIASSIKELDADTVL